MTLYVTTPFGRLAQRNRMMERMLDEEFARQREVFFPVDLKVDGDEFVLTALLPGVKADGLDISIVNETVSLKGEFENGRDEAGEYLLQERPAGHFARTLDLPEAVDSNKAEAHMEDGVLTLRIPKAEEARPKTIKVVSKK